jgi:hypothetical protein
MTQPPAEHIIPRSADSERAEIRLKAVNVFAAFSGRLTLTAAIPFAPFIMSDYKTNLAHKLPPATRERLLAAGIDLSAYPYFPKKPDSLELAASVRGDERVHEDAGKRADPEKKVMKDERTRLSAMC